MTYPSDPTETRGEYEVVDVSEAGIDSETPPDPNIEPGFSELPDTRGMCVNHPCPKFEHVIPCQHGATCELCGHRLLAPNGVDYAGEERAEELAKLRDALARIRDSEHGTLHCALAAIAREALL